MSRAYDYDCIVIGAGAAGLTAAKLANGMGKRVALLEKHRVGGDCTLTGCVPSKTLIKSARVVHLMRNLRQFGIRTKATFNFKGEHILKHVRSVVRDVYNSHAPEKLIESGIDVIYGHARCIDGHTVDINDKHITARRIIIATGSEPKIPPIPGLDSVMYYTNKNLYTMEYLPESLTILGAGPIGLEMASAFSRLGTKVTVVEMQDRILGKEDAEMADWAESNLCSEGVTILKNRKAKQVESYEGAKHLLVQKPDGSQEMIRGSELLIAIGQHPAVADVGLDDAGIVYTEHGITVDSTMRTNIPSIYACGDAVGPYQFSHVAFYQAKAAAQNAFVPFFKQHVSYEHIPWITYITPELATSGMTEEQARQAYGEALRIYRIRYADIDRAHTENELRGCAKFICTTKGKILGIHILGSHAGEIMHEVHTAKHNGLRLQDLFEVVHAYPAYSDIIWDAAKQAYIDNIQRSWWYRAYQWITSFGA